MDKRNKTKAWEKILYESQTQDDSYIPANFMKEYIDCNHLFPIWGEIPNTHSQNELQIKNQQALRCT